MMGIARKRALHPSYTLEAEVGHDLSALVLDDDRAFRALEGGLGLFIAEGRGLLVIRLGGARILRPAASALRKCAHPLERAGMILRRCLLEQGARGDVVLRAADTVRHHQSELI